MFFRPYSGMIRNKAGIGIFKVSKSGHSYIVNLLLCLQVSQMQAVLCQAEEVTNQKAASKFEVVAQPEN